MSISSITSKIAPLIFVLATLVTYAQEQAPEKARIPAQPSSSKRDDQEPIKIFSEEVILPITAYDEYGRFDPTVAPDDVLVLEDGVPQQVTSARRVPVNVVLLIDMGSVLVFSQHLDVTRRVVLRVLSQLRSGDRVILIQFTNRAEVLQDWTEDKAKVASALNPEHGKLLSGNRSRLSEGLVATADKLDGKEAGSTHIVLITDGDDTPGSEYANAVKQLLHYQPTLHVLSYTTLAGQEARKHKSVLNFDREMKRFYKNHDTTIKVSEERLTALVESLGGRIFLPSSVEEALKQGDEIAGEIGARCVLTYIPKHAIESTNDTTPRHIEVFPRRLGLQVHALRTTLSTTLASP